MWFAVILLPVHDSSSKMNATPVCVCVIVRRCLLTDLKRDYYGNLWPPAFPPNYTPANTKPVVSAVYGKVSKHVENLSSAVLHECERRRKVVLNRSRRNCTVWVKKSPLRTFGNFSKTAGNFFNQILCAYYVFLFTLDYEFLFNYLQLWRSYAY